MSKFLARQGDVLIVAVEELPKERKAVQRKNGRVILAEGELSGHFHAIADPDVELFETASAVDRFLRVGQRGAALVHDEHSTIQLPPGNYLVRRQVEFIGRVVD